MKISSFEFLGSYPSMSQIKNIPKPSVAFIGRSNVGKSSFINHLLGSKKIAKISATPGKTQLLNFFEINKNFYFVDLPGYGYAKVPVSVKLNWKKMMLEFLENYSHLKLIIQLVDIRHDLSTEDKEFYRAMSLLHTPLRIIANKSDKIKKKDFHKKITYLQNTLQLQNPPIHHSIQDGQSKINVWKMINEALAKAL